MAEDKELGYERLGAPKLPLVDVVAQSVGFMGPVFSAAFLIPLIVGVNAAGKGAGIAAPLARADRRDRRVRARLDRGAVRQDGSTRRARSTTTSRPGWGTDVGACGRLAVLQRHDGAHGRRRVLIGGTSTTDLHRRRHAPPGVLDVVIAAPGLGVERCLRRRWCSWCSYFGVQISTRVQLTLALISAAVVLASSSRSSSTLGERQRRGEAVQPDRRRTAGRASSSACSTGC